MPSEFFEVYYTERHENMSTTKNTHKLEKLFSTLKYSPIELFEW